MRVYVLTETIVYSDNVEPFIEKQEVFDDLVKANERLNDIRDNFVSKINQDNYSVFSIECNRLLMSEEIQSFTAINKDIIINDESEDIACFSLIIKELEVE